MPGRRDLRGPPLAPRARLSAPDRSARPSLSHPIWGRPAYLVFTDMYTHTRASCARGASAAHTRAGRAQGSLRLRRLPPPPLALQHRGQSPTHGRRPGCARTRTRPRRGRPGRRRPRPCRSTRSRRRSHRRTRRSRRPRSTWRAPPVGEGLRFRGPYPAGSQEIRPALLCWPGQVPPDLRDSKGPVQHGQPDRP